MRIERRKAAERNKSVVAAQQRAGNKSRKT
jgi:hypothetical protein